MSTVLVTGCASAFGKHTALLFGRHGHTVFAAVPEASAAGPMEAVAGEEGIDVRVLAFDHADPASVGAAVAEVADAVGGIDVLVNNPGVSLRGPIEATADDEVAALFETNVYAPLRVIRAVLPAMRVRGTGVIVNVSSIVGLVARPYGGVYSATKHALEAISESLYHELKPFGVRVAVVEPGQFESELVAEARPAADFDASSPYWDSSQRFDTALRRLVPDGKPTPAEVVAETIVAVAFDSDAGLRHLVGADAELIMSVRNAGPFEHYDKTIRAALDWE